MLTEDEQRRQWLSIAKLRQLEISRKNLAMQAKTGNVPLSSDFNRIQKRLKKLDYRYGYIFDLNRSI